MTLPVASTQAEYDQALTRIRQTGERMLHIFPEIERRIQVLKALVAAREDVQETKEFILQALEVLRMAAEKERSREKKVMALRELSPKQRTRLNSLLGHLQLQMARLGMLERLFEDYEKTASPERTKLIDEQVTALRKDLREEATELGISVSAGEKS